MAEGVAAVGVVASIVQLVDFSARVISRLEQFHSDVGEVPKSLRHINTELPVLSAALHRIRQAVEADSVDNGTRNALILVVDGCREQVEQLDAILLKTLPATSDGWRTKSKKAIVSLHQDDKIESIMKILRNYIATLTFYHAAVSSTLQPLTDAKLAKIRQWLSAPDPSINYQKALKQRQDDTGLWFLESDQYAEWKIEAASFLWLHGIPGCGKTILSSTILENVLQHCDSDPGKVVAYFFFDFNDVQKQNPELMVRSLICQLSHQCVSIPTSLDTLFSSCEDGYRQPSLHALLKVVQQMMQEFPHVYVILDALDECSERAPLMEILETMSAWQLQNSHILLASRRERDIESSLEKFVRQQDIVCLQSEIVDRDIQRYVQQRLSNDKQLGRWEKDPTLKQEIEAAIMKGAHGMFRWAVCQLDTLGKCLNRAMLRKSLAALPQTLDHTYDRILCGISDDYSQYAVRILRWLTFSARPLSVDEVAEIVAINLDDEARFNREEVLEDPLDVLTICSSLVTIITDKKSEEAGSARQIVALAHYSVKEYLLSDKIGKGLAAHYGMQHDSGHDDIARSCLGYLLQFQGPEMLCHGDAKEFRLADYSAKFWINHAQQTGGRTNRYTQEAVILLSKNDVYLNWLRIHNVEEFKYPPPPLCYASMFGLRKVVELLLKNGADVNAQGGFFDNALYTAITNGDEEIAELLIKNGADLNTGGGFSSTALHAASDHGEGRIVELLIKAGADVNEQSQYFDKFSAGFDLVEGTALHTASVYNYESIVELLLENGADVNARGGFLGTALHAAVENGNEAIVELLIEAGADINAQGLFYDRLSGDKIIRKGTVLQSASANREEEMVELLLENGADVNAEGGSFDNALTAASYNGDETIVKLLVKAGANVNAHGRYYGDALMLASRRGNEEIVKLLVEKGAIVNAQGGLYSNAFYAASFEGHTAIVKLLLDNSVDVMQAREIHRRTALHLAARGGHIDTFQFLINRGLDLSALDAKGDGVLCYASSGGSLDLLQAVLKLGLTFTSENMRWSPLHWACRAGKPEVIELLVQEGVRSESVTIPEPQGQWSPLDVAVFHGHQGILESLSSSCKALLGLETITTRRSGNRHHGYTCDGCFHSIYGPRFHCRICGNLDYCFMCKPFLDSLHTDHEWEVFKANN